MDNHNQSGSSSSGADSSFGVLAMPYDEFDITLKDINEEELERTLESFFGAGNVVDGQFYSFAIQNQSTRIECQVSRVGTHFEHVNILGIDSLRKLKLNLDIDWDLDRFKLIRK
ncbi:unnamed protein product [Caenorhabditis bovis]|uniref:Uncharacterized protein n=1 Tax=Caenorhabditis bovis TaxID=2654633 RepID=A0A8S1ESG9_9PELO|nr:unnamed protein product [Caenorhabditis bovis]